MHSENQIATSVQKSKLHLPIRTAPAISKTVASKHAWVRVNTLDPTLVPNELATSLAPIPKANMNATTNPHITNQNNSSAYGSIPQPFLYIKTPHRNTFLYFKINFLAPTQFQRQYFTLGNNNFFKTSLTLFKAIILSLTIKRMEQNTACITKLYLIIAIRLNLLKYHK